MRCNWLQRCLGLPDTATGDPQHQQTAQPEPGAMSYAYTALGLPLYTPIGAADAYRGNGFLTIEPQGYQLEAVWQNGFGGNLAGSSYLSQLLINQADYVAQKL